MGILRRVDPVAVAFAVWAVATLGVAVQAYYQPYQHTVFDIYADAARCWWG